MNPETALSICFHILEPSGLGPFKMDVFPMNQDGPSIVQLPFYDKGYQNAI